MAAQNKASPHWVITLTREYGQTTILLVGVIYYIFGDKQEIQTKYDKLQATEVASLKEDVKELKSDFKISNENVRICNEQMNMILNKTVVENTAGFKKLSNIMGRVDRRLKKDSPY